MSTLISGITSRIVGTVEFVSPSQIKVLLEIESPRSTALNTGVPTTFPRINNFVLIPADSGFVVGQIEWLGIEHSAYPKRQGFKDFGLVDLPFPLRKMSLCPIGTLCGEDKDWHLKRGIQNFPSVGDIVILPTSEQTKAIVTGNDFDSHMPIGICPIAYNAEILVNPDKLFGCHLAVLGNTGSGKSCTVASLVRSAVESSRKIKSNPNMRFIILDPNGEYAKCFSDLGKVCRVYQVPSSSGKQYEEFRLPAWMWNSSEWGAITRASAGSQYPILRNALRSLKNTSIDELEPESQALRTIKMFKDEIADYEQNRNKMNFGKHLAHSLIPDLEKYKNTFLSESMETKGLLDEAKRLAKEKAEGQYFKPFGVTEIDKLNDLTTNLQEKIIDEDYNAGINEDTPLPFDVKKLPSEVRQIAYREGNNSINYIATLNMRLETLLSDSRIKGVIDPEDDLTLENWLENYIGSDGAENRQIAIIDLSLVPYDILHTVIAVSSRIIFEALQRYLKISGKSLPTVLILEEAHTFVSKHSPKEDDEQNPAIMCKKTFERIAREGRKFGLGLVLSSQRPSELSETILSQCNTFMIHRITNDKDQQLISRLVPEVNKGLLDELPSLQTRHCILLGITTKIPLLLEISSLEGSQRPTSEDPYFWDVWTGGTERRINWEEIAREWQGNSIEKMTKLEL